MRLIFKSLVILLLAGSAQAATYHVAKTGSDAVSCANADFAPDNTQAKLTIAAGVGCATAPGDIVIVHVGTYTQNVGNWSSGSAGNPIIVRAATGETVNWVSTTAIHNSLDCTVQIFDQSYIRIQGFVFRDSPAGCTIRVVHSDNNKTDGDFLVGIEIVDNTFINNGATAAATGWFGRQVYLQYLGRDSSITTHNLNIVSGNTFTDNYGTHIDFDNTSNTHVFNNVATGGLGRKNDSNANWYQTNLMQMGGTGSQYNRVENNTISDMLRQGYMETNFETSCIRGDVGPNNNLIRNNICHDLDFANSNIHARGIFFESNTQDNLFYNNIIYRISGAGILDGSTPTTRTLRNKYYNNTIYDIDHGIRLSNSNTAEVKNNIIMNADTAEISTTSTAVTQGGNVFSNNIYFNAGRSNIGVWNDTSDTTAANRDLSSWAGVSGETNSISSNPLFTNAAAADFTIPTGSPAKDAGVTLSTVATDYLGVSRPQGVAYDIGAYEFNGGAPPPSGSGQLELRVIRKLQ